ncbi:MAG: hypothetical protein WBM99_11830 [Psychromonas sp.]
MMYKNFIPVAAAILGFGSAYLGVTMGTRSTLQVKKIDALQEVRKEMYADFFNAQAKLLHANSMPLVEATSSRDLLIDEYEFQMKETRFRLAAFAPTEVVNGVFSFYQEAYGYSENCNLKWKADAAIYLALRKQILSDLEEDAVEPRTIYALMFNCLPPADNREVSNTPPLKAF